MWCGNTFSSRVVSLLFQGSFTHLQLMKLQAKIALTVIQETSTPLEEKGLPKL